MRPVKVAINGLGRIGRTFLRAAAGRPDLRIVAVNDLGDLANLIYLLKYDSVYGRFNLPVGNVEGQLEVAGQKIRFLQEKDPARLPWGELGVDVVVEATGVFESYAKAKTHLDAGAHKVVVTAPMKDEPLPGIVGGTVLVGINEGKLDSCQITSNASCTTNAVSPVMQIMLETVGVEKAVLNTVHAYTATQRLVDSPDARDFRRGRAAGVNIVPSSTGAAIAVSRAIPELEGFFDGLAIRVPVVSGSIADLTFIAKRQTSVEEINEILKQAAAAPRWQGIFSVSEEPLVSSDVVGSVYASIADLPSTLVVGGTLVKVLAWYDNELGYVHTLVRHVLKLGGAGGV